MIKTTEHSEDEMESFEDLSFYGQRQYSAGVLRGTAVIRIVHAPILRRKLDWIYFLNCGPTATSKAYLQNNVSADTKLHKYECTEE